MKEQREKTEMQEKVIDYTKLCGKRKSFEAAYLPCENTPSCGRWVIHTFHSCVKKDCKLVVYDHLWKCSKCGTVTEWGNSTNMLEPANLKG